MDTNALLRQSLSITETEIERLTRELDRLRKFREDLLSELEGKPAPTDASQIGEPVIEVNPDEPLVPLVDPQTGKRLRQRDRIVRLLRMWGPMVRREIRDYLRMSKHTLNFCLSDNSVFRNKYGKWYLTGHDWNGTAWISTKEEPSPDTGTEQDSPKTQQ